MPDSLTKWEYRVLQSVHASLRDAHTPVTETAIATPRGSMRR